MALTLEVNGVDKSAKFWLSDNGGDVSASFIAGAVGSMRVKVYDLDGPGGYRPAIDDVVKLKNGASTVLAGLLDEYEESPLTDLDTGLVRDLTVSDYNGYTDRVSYNIAYNAGTSLLAMITDVVASKLAGFGVTVDAGSAGCALVFFATTTTFGTNPTVRSILNRLTSLSGYPWRITPTKTLLMAAPASVSCGYMLSDADNTGVPGSMVLGVVRYRQSRQADYANAIILTCGTAKQVLKDEAIAATAGQSSWALTYPSANIVVDPTGFIVSRGYVTEAGVNQTLGVYGDPSVSYQWRASNNSLYRTAGAVGGATAISFGYYVQLPFNVTYTNAAEVAAHGVYEGYYDAPDIEDYAEGLAQATALGRRTITTPQTVVVRTDKGPAYPGQSVALSFADRSIVGTFMVTALDIASAENGTLEYTLTCVSGTELDVSWLDFFRDGSSGGAGGGVGGSVSGAAVASTVLNGTVFLGGSDRTMVAANPVAWVRVPNALPYVPQANLSVKLRAMIVSHTISTTVELRVVDELGNAPVVVAPTASTGPTPKAVSGTGLLVALRTYFLEMKSGTAGDGISAIGSLESA